MSWNSAMPKRVLDQLLREKAETHGGDHG